MKGINYSTNLNANLVFIFAYDNSYGGIRIQQKYQCVYTINMYQCKLKFILKKSNIYAVK